MPEQELPKTQKTLIRHLLASIDLTDIVAIQLEEDSIDEKSEMGRATDTEIFYKNIFSKIIKTMYQAQLEFMGKEAETTDQVIFSKGTINGLSLVKEWFEDQDALAKSRHNQPKEEEEPSPDPFPET